MNKKLVAKTLKKQHKAFIESITDDKVKELVDKNGIITGGSIVSLLLNDPVNDYDYYFRNKETVIAVAGYYAEKFHETHPHMQKPIVVVKDDRVTMVIASDGIVADEDAMRAMRAMRIGDVEDADETPATELEPEDKPKYRPVFISANAITLSDKVQLVLRFYGDPDEIHKNYDFIHCTNYWTSDDGKLTLQQAALESILCKQLHYTGSLYPVCSVIRTRKFLKQGWHINAGQFLKMCFQISKLDLTDISVLEDQLTGVDALYFSQVIHYCRDRKEKDASFEVTTPYLVSIIDRIF